MVFADLDRAGVRWCLLRDSPRGEDSDVDLLIAPEDLRAASGVFAAHQARRVRSLGYGSHRFFVGLDAPRNTWIKLDVVTELGFGPGGAFTIAGAGDLLARAVRDRGVARPAPGDAFWLLLLHCLLDKGRIDERHRETLSSLAPAPQPSPL